MGEAMKIYVGLIVMLTFGWLALSLAFIQHLDRQYGKPKSAERKFQN